MILEIPKKGDLNRGIEMWCPRCSKQGKQSKMKPQKKKGGFHKQIKWVCPNCGLVRMQKHR